MKKILSVCCNIALMWSREKSQKRRRRLLVKQSIATSQKDESTSSSSLVDLTNPGIGPVKDLIFSNINDEMVPIWKTTL